MQGNVCYCPHHKVIPILVVLLGLDFLLGALGVLSMQAVNVIWPILIVAAGLQKLFAHKCTCCSHEMPKKN